MKRAVIFYQSKTGTTKHFAQEIGAYLQTREIETACLHVDQYQECLIENADYLIMGCWTKGLMVLFQRPDAIWNCFAQKISIPGNSKIALFTTYKILTGSMFKEMEKPLNPLNGLSIPKLKSRDGKLSDSDRAALDEFIDN